jgi:hypothetical protein
MNQKKSGKLSASEMAEMMNKDWHELPPDLRDQLLGLEVTTDEERMKEILRERGNDDGGANGK